MLVCLPPVPAALAVAPPVGPATSSVRDQQRIEKDLSEASDAGLLAKRSGFVTNCVDRQDFTTAANGGNNNL